MAHAVALVQGKPLNNEVTWGFGSETEINISAAALLYPFASARRRVTLINKWSGPLHCFPAEAGAYFVFVLAVPPAIRRAPPENARPLFYRGYNTKTGHMASRHKRTSSGATARYIIRYKFFRSAGARMRGQLARITEIRIKPLALFIGQKPWPLHNRHTRRTGTFFR